MLDQRFIHVRAEPREQVVTRSAVPAAPSAGAVDENGGPACACKALCCMRSTGAGHLVNSPVTGPEMKIAGTSMVRPENICSSACPMASVRHSIPLQAALKPVRAYSVP